ncbi:MULTISPECIES: hypothetical protein [unclassified Novosphingobium]|uniref:hypothetical protein n=1 Tax=Novosphingobium TaxID=165696 RepID=UPI0009FC0CC0|nr:hypothetical protein [Novosphingobium sp. BK280]MBB3378641.1 hypothetical protein [Novosphingobium sp. BK258]MBB3420335.1 hypothetical protein [Novosphingobium sp. BK267]
MFQPDLFASEPATSLPPSRAGRRPRRALAGKGAPVAGPDGGADAARVQPPHDIDLPAVLEKLAEVSTRPRYTFMVLNLIARAAGTSDSAGPYVREGGQAIPVRDWLSDALIPMAQRDARRRAVVEEVRAQLARKGTLPADPAQAEQAIATELRDRLRHSGRTNVSRAVSDLVRAGLIRRHYQGYCVDHENRGAQREAVYTIIPAVKRALGHAA